MQNPGTRRAIIHIGHEKTGTTTIQRSLYRNRAKLLSTCNILYPSITANHSIPLSVVFKERLPALLKVAEPAARDSNEGVHAEIRQGYAERLEKQLSKRGWNSVILSAESLCDFTPAQAQSLLDWIGRFVDEVQVVAYVRHPVDWLRSVVQQRLKTGATLEEFAHRQSSPRWEKRFSYWLNAVGKDGFHVINFEDAIPHIFDSFRLVAGIPQNIAAGPDLTQVNKSMSLEAALILSSFNRLMKEIEQDSISVVWKYRSIYNKILPIPGRRFTLPFAIDAARYRLMQQDTDWLRDVFGINYELGDLDQLRSADEEGLGQAMSIETSDSIARLLRDLAVDRALART